MNTAMNHGVSCFKSSAVLSAPAEKPVNILPTNAAPPEIVSALKNGERLVDDVIAETGLPAGKVLATLTLLEVKGVVKRLPGKRVCL